MKINNIKRLSALLICICIIIGLSACTTTDQEMAEYLNRNGFTFQQGTNFTTPKNSSVQAIKYVSTLSSAQIKDIDDSWADEIKKQKWDATPVSGKGPTLDYNCHAFAWERDSSKHTRWIWQNQFNFSTGVYTNTANLSEYWTDGSYSLRKNGTVSGNTIPTSAANGDKVFYANGDHSARLTSKSNGKVTSKWGMSAQYVHSPGHAPYTVTSMKYYQYYK